MMIEKAEMLHRLHALVDRVRLSSAVVGSPLTAELLALEAEQRDVDAALARIIDTYQDGLYRKHNVKPVEFDAHGLSGQWQQARGVARKIA